MKKIISLPGIFLYLFFQSVLAQPSSFRGFDPPEYLDLLDINLITHKDSISPGTSAGSTQRYQLIYRSPEMGLMNRWELWMRSDNTAVISIRGTVMKPASWAANFYSAMVPATGSLQINDSTVFTYKLASDPKAAVHAGWTTGLAHIGPDIVHHLKKLYAEKSVRHFIIMGHSQGGALTFLTTSYLFYLRENGDIPGDIQLKSYCSAAPQPGNIYYTYDFDFITRNGSAYTIVNTADWVPETPHSIQTLSDYNSGNPFANLKDVLGSQKLLVRWYLKSMFRKMDRTNRKAQAKMDKYLGDKMFLVVRKILPQFREPQYAGTSNFMRAGTPVVLMPDEEYRQKFPDDPKATFKHHLFEPYIFLLRKYYQVK